MFRISCVGLIAVLVATTNAQVATSKFSCKERPSGYYADIGSGCQVYHMCDGLGRQFSYTCPNATLFQQRMLICDHWYMVNCEKSEQDYAANLRIGQREMPFVDDSESNPYHRTPRPDLLSHPSEAEYNIIYRTGRAQVNNNINLVGAESDSKSNQSPITDQPSYFLPSHWSTEYSQETTTTKSVSKDRTTSFNTKKILQNNIIKGKPVVNTQTEIPINYKSYYKATTPVFPKSVEATSPVPDQLGLLPPLPYQVANKSDDESPEVVAENTVNFRSDFKATTPVYPTSVEPTSPDPSDLGLLPPSTNLTSSIENNPSVPSLILDIVPPAVDVNFKPEDRKVDNSEVSEPSKFYQPPKFQPDYTTSEESEVTSPTKRDGLKSLNTQQWEDLRKSLLIPDYEFPLESVSRPSYDSVLSSFQVDPSSTKRK